MPPAEERDDGRTDEPVASRDRNKLAAFYRAKAQECLRVAESMSDPQTRQHWLDIANGWTQLALHAER
jgi:hypothetical protein